MIWGAPPVINDAGMAKLAADCARDVVGDDMVIDHLDAPNMGGEDFAYYLEKAPGAFMFLSSSNPAKGTDVSHHNPKFDVDERGRILDWIRHICAYSRKVFQNVINTAQKGLLRYVTRVIVSCIWCHCHNGNVCFCIYT